MCKYCTYVATHKSIKIFKLYVPCMSAQLYGLCMFSIFASVTPTICYYVKRPLVIQGLLAGYDARSIGVGSGHGRMVSEHELYRTQAST